MRIRLFLFLLALTSVAVAQHTDHAPGFGICKPVAQRQNNADGCWILSDEKIGKLSQPETYWHLDSYPSQAAAEAAKTPSGTVLQAHSRWWVMTIEQKDWRAKTGDHVANIGPLPVKAAEDYSALYMEAVQDPGATSAIHRHSGPEAWYTLGGATCLETDSGKFVETPGSAPVIVPEGAQMELMAVGKEKRRAITLILHKSVEPPTTMVKTWTPKGLCKQP